jgi:hypothetical protein
LEKGQFRETSEIVKKKNIQTLPIFFSVSWHYNFYFYDSKFNVVQLPTSDFLEMFWLLQGVGVRPKK